MDVVLRSADDVPAVSRTMAGIAGVPVEVDDERRRVSVPVRDRMRTLTDVVRALDGTGIEAEDVALRRPTLDEVFLHLTGHATEQSNDSGTPNPDRDVDRTTETSEVTA